VLLLDDVLSELDHERRSRLFEVLETGGQALITTADPESALAVADGASDLRVEQGGICEEKVA
jgi:recombinational DNA repair ATPase RecF